MRTSTFALLAALLFCVFQARLISLHRRQKHSVRKHAISEDQKQAILDAHNQVRSNLGLNALTWDDEAANVAQNYASQCVWAHNQDRGNFGENLYAAGVSSYSDEVVTEMVVKGVGVWAAEEAYYDYESNSCTGGKVCGHYTQVVWAATTGVGCGVAECQDTIFSGWDAVYMVCDYSPPGNITGDKPY